jgi:hypothetical protein
MASHHYQDRRQAFTSELVPCENQDSGQAPALP